jgi:hypothetical protein
MQRVVCPRGISFCQWEVFVANALSYRRILVSLFLFVIPMIPSLVAVAWTQAGSMEGMNMQMPVQDRHQVELAQSESAQAGLSQARQSAELFSEHMGSGTAWEPATVPAHDWMLMRGGWEMMAHGVIFIDYNQQGGPRGEGKAEVLGRDDLVASDVLGGVADLTASRISGVVSDWRDVSRRAIGRSSASA